VPRSRMRTAIPPLPQYTFMTWCSVKKKTQRQFLPLPDIRLETLRKTMVKWVM